MIEDQFKLALADAGIPTKDPIIADGYMHRFHIEGDKPGSKNGWYILFNDGIAAGAFGSWKHAIKHKWCAQEIRNLNYDERRHLERLRGYAEAERQYLTEGKQEAARKEARSIWNESKPCEVHPYLRRKNVKSYGLRIAKNGRLLVPLYDIEGTLQSIQFINGWGYKIFLRGGKTKGCHYTIGSPTEHVCITEGYATAASVHQSTGMPVIVAFNAINLVPVALEVRKQFPDIKIILCADNDREGTDNVGVKFATKAASVVGGSLAVAEDL